MVSFKTLKIRTGQVLNQSCNTIVLKNVSVFFSSISSSVLSIKFYTRAQREGKTSRKECGKITA